MFSPTLWRISPDSTWTSGKGVYCVRRALIEVTVKYRAVICTAEVRAQASFQGAGKPFAPD